MATVGQDAVTAGAGRRLQDAGFYAVADYRLRNRELPLGWVALLAQVGGRRT